MLYKKDIINKIIKTGAWQTTGESVRSFAPSNIALAKYWGKRDSELNLPMNSSLSISLAEKGATALLTPSSQPFDTLIINQNKIDHESHHAQRLIQYLNLFRGPQKIYYDLSLQVNIPFAAGLASSACVFAVIIQALNQLHRWSLSKKELSILARLGSGSAARSIAHGFVQWHQGDKIDGLDSYAEPLTETWPDLCIGLCILNRNEKSVSSREGMKRTMATSPLYDVWPQTANQAVHTLKKAIQDHDFHLLGKTAENNALTMHATMLSAFPPLLYSIPETIAQMQHIWYLRHAGLPLYFTQDAGPNLKLLCMKKDIATINSEFKNIEWVYPFKEVGNSI